MIATAVFHMCAKYRGKISRRQAQGTDRTETQWNILEKCKRHTPWGFQTFDVW